MKVLHVINSLATGGAEKLLLETIPLYVKNGVVTDLLVLNDNNYPFMQALRVTGCCNIISLGNGSVYNPLHIFKMIRHIKKYDIVHVHLFPSQYFAVLAKILSFSKVKLIFTEHNTSNRRLENPIFRFVDRFVYRFYTKVVCITPEIRDILLQHTGQSAEVFEVIENGVNLETIKSAAPIDKTQIHPGITAEDKLIIQVAAFREQKDQMTLIRTMQHIKIPVKVLFVGDGSMRSACEELAAKLGLQDKILFLGVRMDVPRLLKSADIVVLSTHYEGLSLSSIEGMASGKPFVASDVPGLREVVIDAGILFPVGDDKLLASEIGKLLTDSSHWNNVAAACMAKAESYDINIMVHKHLKLYGQVGK